jgi:hypothetical protein
VRSFGGPALEFTRDTRGDCSFEGEARVASLMSTALALPVSFEADAEVLSNLPHLGRA